MKEIEENIVEIIPDINPSQLNDIMDIIWKFANEYASEAIESAMSSLARYGR